MNKARITTDRSLHDKNKILLRASGLQQFMNCRHQWYMVNILGNRQKPAAALSIGTSVHMASEVGFTEKIITGKLPPLSVCTDAAMETWRDEIENNPEMEFKEGETALTCESIVLEAAKSLYEDVMVFKSPTFVERTYRLDLDHPIVEAAQGSLDIGFESTHADIKVTARKTTPSNYIAQQSMYSLLRMEAGEDIWPESEIYNPIKGKGQCLVLDLPVKPEYARFLVNTILDVTEQFHKTGDDSLFYGTCPTTWYLCSPGWCGFWKDCKYVKELR